MIRTTTIDERSPWYASPRWPSAAPKQVTYDDAKTLYDVLVEHAEEAGDAPALWFLDTWISYGQLLRLVDRFAGGLSDLGVRQGEVLALLLPNCPQFVVAYYAAIKLGVIVTPINPTHKPAEVKHQLEITRARHLICLDALHAPVIAPIQEQAGLETLISTNLVDLADGLSSLKKALGKLLGKIPKARVRGAARFMDLLSRGIEAPRAEIRADVDASVYLMTGGTTGEPKAAVLTYTNQYVNALQSLGVLAEQRESEDAPPVGPGTGNLCALPLFHAFAMSAVLNFSLVSRGFVVLFPRPPKARPLCETLQKLPDLNGYIYCAAEILFQRLNDFEDLERYDITSKLRISISGAGPLHPQVQERFEARTRARITEGYGLTEASPIVSVGNFFGADRCTGTLGLPYPGTEWAIFPADDLEAGPLEGFGVERTGELCVSGPQVMQGYLDEPEQTAEAIREWGGRRWLRTGDIGFMDAHGCVILRDRKKQLIKVRGHSVFPKEIETLLGAYPEVADVACAGVPEAEGAGEYVKAWVKLTPGAEITEEALLTRCREGMAHFKVPKVIEFRDEIPRSLIGKVMRRALQEEEERRRVEGGA